MMICSLRGQSANRTEEISLHCLESLERTKREVFEFNEITVLALAGLIRGDVKMLNEAVRGAAAAEV